MKVDDFAPFSRRKKKWPTLNGESREGVLSIPTRVIYLTVRTKQRFRKLPTKLTQEIREGCDRSWRYLMPSSPPYCAVFVVSYI